MTTNWQSQLKQALRNKHPVGLQNSALYSSQAANKFAPVITSEMLKIIEWEDTNDPILAQFLPAAAENTETAEFVSDPVGDANATKVPGLIHKYHGRVLLIASGSCAVNCRYCFRRHFPYSQSFAPRHQWRDSVAYIADHTEIHEVILSGGDPLSLETKTLATLTDQLQNLPHIKTLRIHSRIPVVLPTRIDAAFSAWADALPFNKVMVLHINHHTELTEGARAAIVQLKSLGFVLLNQSVLLKNINDDVATLKQLSFALFACGVLPYYLNQMDPVQNAAHFVVSDDSAITIHRQLKAELSGYLVPKLVKEIAGEQNKTQINT